MNKKILASIKAVRNVSLRHQNLGKKVGLVVGGFDVMHMGHINLFKLAKKHVDVLIIGLDSDETLKLTKGQNRPINNFYRRSNFLAELEKIDYVFKIPRVFVHGDKVSTEYFKYLYGFIKPTHVFTHIKTDSWKKDRKCLAKLFDIKFVTDTTKTVTHSSEIIRKLEKQ